MPARQGSITTRESVPSKSLASSSRRSSQGRTRSSASTALAGRIPRGSSEASEGLLLAFGGALGRPLGSAFAHEPGRQRGDDEHDGGHDEELTQDLGGYPGEMVAMVSIWGNELG